LTRIEGDLWKKHRKVLTSAFKYEFFNDMIPEILELSKDFLKIEANKPTKILGPI